MATRASAGCSARAITLVCPFQNRCSLSVVSGDSAARGSFFGVEVRKHAD